MPPIGYRDILRVYRTGDLLVGAAATGTSGWKYVGGCVPLVVTVRGTFVATLQVYVETSDTKPADTDTTGAPLGPPISAPSDTPIIVNAPVNWVLINVSAYTSGSINASFAAGT